MKEPTVSLIIPTKDSKHLLTRHIKDLVEIASIALDVIVVDSSADNQTLDYLKKHLPPSKTQYYSTEPGLYQAWNFAIQKAAGDYLHIATSGDRIDVANFSSLLTNAIQTSADITIGPPRFLSEQGNCIQYEWPIHKYLRTTKQQDDHILDSGLLVRWNLLLFPTTLIGSSANNIYKTSYLQQHPFPTDSGAQGDAVWAAMHCLDARWAISPGSAGDFIMHNADAKKASVRKRSRSFQLSRISHYYQGSTPVTDDTGLLDTALHYLELAEETSRIRDKLNNRRKRICWFLSIKTWKVRATYKKRKQAIHSLVTKEQISTQHA